MRCFRAKAVLMSPVTPAAASKCPTLPFTDPIAQNCRSLVPAANALVKPAISMGSPRGVAVPWHST